MAAGTTSPETSQTRPAGVDAFSGQIVEYDRYIETQLHRTRRQVKGVDIASSLMLLALASLVYLMLVALVDQWVVVGGLSFAGRMAAFGILAFGIVAFVVLRLGPLVMRRINPVYAAYTIERHRPGIKNSLINFLLLRSSSERLPERIYEAMEVQAANALSTTHAEVAVDRAPVIRLLMALVAVVFCVSLYAVLSPKNPFTSFRRVISPWSDVAPPTRVAISDIQPGNGQGFHDQHVAVSAVIVGERESEPVMLRYSTRDGQVVGRGVPMTLLENSYRHAAELPPDNLGLQQDLEYWIEAGDAISPHYRIKVDTAPTIVVEELEYQYPKYTELPPRKVARHGDIQALAGTRVSLRAKANQVIRQANLDFECDGRNDLDMHVEGPRASVTFPLVWSDKTRRAEHESYQLRFRNDDGHENHKPIRYSIEVIRDLPPEVELVEPELDPAKDLMVPAGKPVRFTVQAADPDFKLASVKFHARRAGTPLVEESLLAESREGQFRRDYMLDLKRLAVKPGEQIEFWAAADDNREPDANHSETPHYRLRVASPDEKGQEDENPNAANQDKNRQSKPNDANKKDAGERHDNQDQEGNEDGEAGNQESNKQKPSGGKSKSGNKDQRQQQQGDNSDDQQSSEGGQSDQTNSEDKSQTGGSSEKKSGDGQSDAGDGEKGQGTQGDQKDGGEKSDESKRIDPQRDAGKAIDEINKHFNKKEEKQEQQDDQQQGDQQSGEKSGEEQPQNQQDGSQGDKAQQGKSSNKKSQQQKSAGKPGDKQDSSQQGAKSGDKKDAQQQPERTGEQKSDQSQSGEQQGESGASKEQQTKRGDTSKGAQKKGDQSAVREKAGGENEKGEQPEQQADQGEKRGDKQGAKGGKQPSSGEKGQTGEQQGEPNEGGDKTEKDKTGGGKEGEANEGDEQPKHADGETKPRDGQGGQAKGAGESDEKMKKHDGQSPDQKGGDPESKDKGEGGAGDSEGANKHGSPTTHGGNQDRKKKQLSPNSKKGTSEDEPESSSESKRQSDSQSGQQGEQDGGGKAGGGQRSNSEGTGSAGQNSEADQGGGQGETKGKGATGKKGGDQQKAGKPTGGKPSGEKGPGTNQAPGEKDGDQKQPSGEKRPAQPQKNDNKKPTERAPQAGASNEGPEGQPTPSDRGGNDVRGGQQRNNPTTGGLPGPDETSPPPESDDSEPGGDDPNQEYARKATDLALERLKDQLGKVEPDPELLEKLRWTREDMERFYQQWERLKKAADESGPKGEAARQELDDALRGLGLRPRGTSLTGGQKRDDRLRNLREGRRTPPPAEYQEQWIEFNKATSRGRK